MNEENIIFNIKFINEYLKENKNIFYNNLLLEYIDFPNDIIEKLKYLINNLEKIKLEKIQFQKIYDILENYSKNPNNNLSNIQDYIKKLYYFYNQYINDKYINIRNKLDSNNSHSKKKKYYLFFIFNYLYFNLRYYNEKEINNNNFPSFYLNFLDLYYKCKIADDINNFYIEIVFHIFIKYIIEYEFNKGNYLKFLNIFKDYLLNLKKNKKEVKTIKYCFICLLLGYIFLLKKKEETKLIEDYKKSICDILFENFYLKNFLVDIICGNFFDSLNDSSSLHYISRNFNLLILSDKEICENFGHVNFFKLILENKISFFQFLLIKDFNNINIIKELYNITLYFFNLQSDIINKKNNEIQFNDSIKYLNAIFLQNILNSFSRVIVSSKFIVKNYQVINPKSETPKNSESSEIINYYSFYKYIFNFLDNYIEINENYKIEWDYIINIINELKEYNKLDIINPELLNKININFEKIIKFNNKETIQKFEYLFKEFKTNSIEPYLTIYLNRVKNNNINESKNNEFFLQAVIYDNPDFSFFILKELINNIRFNKNEYSRKIENLIIDIYSNIITKIDNNNNFIYKNLDTRFFNLIINFFYYINDEDNILQAIKVFLYSKRNEEIFLNNYFLFIKNIIWLLNYSFNKNKMKMLIDEIFNNIDGNNNLIIEILLQMKIKNEYEIHIKKDLDQKKISKIPILRLKNEDEDEKDIFYPFVSFDYYEILNKIMNNKKYFVENKKKILYIILKNIKENSFNEKNMNNLMKFLKENIKYYSFDNENLKKNEEFFLFNKILKFINYRIFFDKNDLINLKIDDKKLNNFSKIQIFKYYHSFFNNISTNNFNDLMANKVFFILFDNFIYYINSLYNDESDILLNKNNLDDLLSILIKINDIFLNTNFILNLKILFLCFNLKSCFIKLNDEQNLIIKFFFYLFRIYEKIFIGFEYVEDEEKSRVKNFFKIYIEIILFSYSELIKDMNEFFLNFNFDQINESSVYLKEILMLIFLYKIKNRNNFYNVLLNNPNSKIYMSENDKKFLFNNYNNENNSYDLFFINLTSSLKYNLCIQKNNEFVCSEDEKLNILNDELNIKDDSKTSLKNEFKETNSSEINFDNNNNLLKSENLMNTFSLLLNCNLNYSSQNNFNLNIFFEFEKNNKRLCNINITNFNCYINKKNFDINEKNYINFLSKIGDIKLEKNIKESYINYENNFYNLCIYLNKLNNINFESISIIFLENFNFNFKKIKDQLFNYCCLNLNIIKNYYIILVVPFNDNLYRIKIYDYYSNKNKKNNTINNINNTKYLKNYISTSFLIDISLSSGRNYFINTIIFLYEFNNFLFADSNSNLFNERFKILNSIFSNK